MAKKKTTETTTPKKTVKKAATKKTVKKVSTVATSKSAPTTVSDNYVFRVVVIALLMVNALVWVASLISSGGPSNNIVEALNQHEAAKMWGEEVFDVFQKLVNSDEYKSQQLDTFNNLLTQLESGDTQPSAAPTAQAAPSEIDSDTISDILEDRPMMGNTDSNIVLIEYTDMECPFCKRLHDSGVVDQLVANNNISATYSHFPLGFHPNAGPAGEAAESVRVNVGDEAYFEYKSAIFAGGTLNSASIIAAAVSVWADADQVQADLDAGTYTALVQAQMSEGSSLFGVSGTPGNVLLNTDTGKFELVSWAAPLANFEAALANIQ